MGSSWSSWLFHSSPGGEDLSGTSKTCADVSCEVEKVKFGKIHCFLSPGIGGEDCKMRWGFLRGPEYMSEGNPGPGKG